MSRRGKMPEIIRDPEGSPFRTVRIDRAVCEFKCVLISEYSGRLSHACTFSPGMYGERCKKCPANDEAEKTPVENSSTEVNEK